MNGIWTCLDPVTPEEFEEDRPYLQRSPYADNIVVPSGRSWRYSETQSEPLGLRDRLQRMAAGYFG